MWKPCLNSDANASCILEKHVAAPTTARPSGPQKIRTPTRELPVPLNLSQTAVGKKWVMAVTGVVLIGFVLGHMFGNLKIYIGPVAENGVWEYDLDVYAEYLRELLVPLFPRTWFLWLLRFGLIAAFGLHIHAAYSLTYLNQKANRAYESKRDWQAANWASRTTRYTGTVILLYLIFHLADLTWGLLSSDWERGHVQANVVDSLSNPLVALIYAVATVALAVHLFHGVRSMFQTLGLNNPRYALIRQGLQYGIAAVVLVGNLSFPLAVVTGLVDADASCVGQSVEATDC
ncbi:MAG: succinate dehydrogenase cytochrome b subunit [Acidimicrobiales bacterium]|nr:succinate dehydrogenase cytochrome b subunit [Acidimicrobiales bacterium]